MKLKVSFEEIKLLAKLRTLYELDSVNSKLEQYEKKYGKTFEEFKREVEQTSEEFEKWDDLIEWEALVEYREILKKKLEEIDDATDVEIIR
ncbi:MAG: hypothetical protein J7L34_02675 [Thermotogaceae bacterium]|nr:hypothetical protein [Thermotogaceae bacterium]